MKCKRGRRKASWLPPWPSWAAPWIPCRWWGSLRAVCRTTRWVVEPAAARCRHLESEINAYKVRSTTSRTSWRPLLVAAASKTSGFSPGAPTWTGRYRQSIVSRPQFWHPFFPRTSARVPIPWTAALPLAPVPFAVSAFPESGSDPAQLSSSKLPKLHSTPQGQTLPLNAHSLP